LKERDALGDLTLDGSKILKSVLKKYECGCGLDLCGSGYGPVGFFEHDNEPPGSKNILTSSETISFSRRTVLSVLVI
jgi:hypothetical protein